MKHLILRIMCLISTLGHAMQQSDKQSSDELLKLMAGKHLEQAKQELQRLPASPDKSDAQQASTPQLIHELIKHKKNINIQGLKTVTVFTVSDPSAEFIKKQEQAGYLVCEHNNGITGFCLPGYEHELHGQLETQRKGSTN